MSLNPDSRFHSGRRTALKKGASGIWGALNLGLGITSAWPLFFAPTSAHAKLPEGWPSSPINLIVPWPAGGATDLTMRILAEEAGTILKQSIVVTNKPGAAGTLVAPLLKTSPADGYTIGQLPVTVLRHALMNKVSWDPLRDLTPILQVSGTTFGILVPGNSPHKTLDDLIRWARAQPDQLTVGSTGVGSTPHLAMEEVLEHKAVKYIHVPYKGTSDQMMALVKGEIMAGVNSTGFAPWVADGRLRLLAVFSEQRSPRWPNVPTMKELGYANAVYNSPWGLVAPAGTDADIVSTLHKAFKQAMFKPRLLELLERYDQEPAYLSTADYRKELQQVQASERKLLHRLHLLSESGN